MAYRGPSRIAAAHGPGRLLAPHRWRRIKTSAVFHVCVPKSSSRSCDQPIFVDPAPGGSVSSDAVLVKIDRFGQRLQRRGAVQGAVRPMLVMVGLVLAQDPPQMVLVPDQGAVQ